MKKHNRIDVGSNVVSPTKLFSQKTKKSDWQVYINIIQDKDMKKFFSCLYPVTKVT